MVKVTQKNTTVFEFWDGEARLGGLISIVKGEGRSLIVDLYRLDEGIEVRVSPDRDKPL